MMDKELSTLKYKALRPYLECIEGQIIIYRERFIAFAILSNVEVYEQGFRANVRALDPIFHPPYITNEIDGLKWSMAGALGMHGQQPWQDILPVCQLVYMARKILRRIYRKNLSRRWQKCCTQSNPPEL